MRYALMLEPQQGMSYEDQLASATRAEANGFDAFFRADHFASFPGEAGQPTTDAWSVLAGLARETKRIKLGALVSPVTFRHPGVFAKVVTTVDEMSGGRIEVAAGAGWNNLEHRQLGLRLPPIEQRADPARVVGRAGWLVVRRHHRHQGAGRAVPASSGRGRGSTHDPDRRPPASDHRGE
jgi:alkanesulfonate monooxygenase SsuD/methylene tetrahydromethanopterin reductase-like flavin-dependent oxidoreductase (luciferase family)